MITTSGYCVLILKKQFHEHFNSVMMFLILADFVSPVDKYQFSQHCKVVTLLVLAIFFLSEPCLQPQLTRSTYSEFKTLDGAGKVFKDANVPP